MSANLGRALVEKLIMAVGRPRCWPNAGRILGDALVVKLFAIAVASVLVIPIPFARAGATSPLTAVQALMDAEQAFDLDRALSLFADDAVIVSAAGVTTRARKS